MQNPNNILLLGATGFIGSRLVKVLTQQKWKLHLISRNPTQARQRFPYAQVEASLDQFSKQTFQACVNLAGAAIAEKRWSKRRKTTLTQSRVQTTKQLTQFLLTLPRPPEVVIQGSAIGYYGFSATQEFTETDPPAQDFLGQLAQAWEAAASPLAQAGIRLCQIRTALVLGPQGGALRKMLPPFQLGLGGPLGRGKQPMSWIHLDDEVGAILHLLRNPNCRGAYNLAAPEVPSNQAFTKALARALRRPAFLPLPAVALRLALGEMSCLLLQGQRVSCAKLLESGYHFQYPELSAALGQICSQLNPKTS